MIKELEEKVCTDYVTGLSMSKTAIKNGVSAATVFNILKKNRVQSRPKNVLNKSQILEVISMYLNEKKSAEDIRLKFGVSNWTIVSALKSHGVKRRSNCDYKKYAINECVFDNLDSKSKLWLLGWFFSDGNVNKDMSRSSITTHKKDIEVHNKFNHVLESNYPATIEKNMVVLYIYSKKIGSALNQLGCVPAKSNIIKYPEFKEEWQHWAFLRGVFEGDGSLGIKHKKANSGVNFDIASGSLCFLESIKDICKKYLNIECKISHRLKCNNKYGNSYRLVILGGSKNIVLFLDKIYDDGKAIDYLDRKFNLYYKIKNKV